MKKMLKKMNKQEEKEQKKGNKKVKYTQDGLRIYNTEELGIGKGGETDQCPFDCDCCF